MYLYTVGFSFYRKIGDMTDFYPAVVNVVARDEKEAERIATEYAVDTTPGDGYAMHQCKAQRIPNSMLDQVDYVREKADGVRILRQALEKNARRCENNLSDAPLDDSGRATEWVSCDEIATWIDTKFEPYSYYCDSHRALGRADPEYQDELPEARLAIAVLDQTAPKYPPQQ